MEMERREGSGDVLQNDVSGRLPSSYDTAASEALKNSVTVAQRDALIRIRIRIRGRATAVAQQLSHLTCLSDLSPRHPTTSAHGGLRTRRIPAPRHRPHQRSPPSHAARRLRNVPDKNKVRDQSDAEKAR